MGDPQMDTLKEIVEFLMCENVGRTLSVRISDGKKSLRFEAIARSASTTSPPDLLGFDVILQSHGQPTFVTKGAHDERTT